MKCYVCSKTYEGSECPRCRFPNVQVPNTTWEEARQALIVSINAFRTNFLQSIQAGLVIYHHKDEDGVYVLDREETVSLGSGTDLYEKELWLDREFARLEDAASVSVRLKITVGDSTREEQVSLPNLRAPELQQIGISLDDQFQFRLKLRNVSEKPTCSAPVEV